MAGQTVVVSVLADQKNFAKGMKSLGGLGKKVMAGLAVAGVMAIGAVGGATKALIKHGEASSTAEARTTQITKSMDLFGKQAEQVAARVNRVADATARQTGMDTNSVKAAQAKMLTFKELAKTADQVGGAFDRATQVAVDLEAAGFGKASQSAVQLGKALNDPTKGITALTRVGITFTEAEKKKIAALQASGKMAQAQDVILKALETQVGGTAAATANMTDRVKTGWTQVQEHLGQKLLPAVDIVGQAFLDAMPGIEKFFGPIIDGVVSLLKGFQGLSSGSGGLIGQIATLAQSASPLGIVLKAIQPILPQLTAGFGEIAASLSSALGQVLPQILPLTDTLATVLGSVLAAILPVIVDLVGVLAGVFAQVLPPLAGLVTTLVSALAPIMVKLTPIIALLAKTLGAVLAAVMPVITTLITALADILAELVPALLPIVDAVAAVVSAFAPMIVLAAQLVGDLLPPLIAIVAKVVVSLIQGLAPALKYIADAVKSQAAHWQGFVTALVSAYFKIKAQIGKVMKIFGDLKAAVKKALGDPLGFLRSFGTSVVQGLWDGILGTSDWLRGKITGWVGDVEQWFKTAFKVNSPSKLTIPIGGALPEGMGVGFDRNLGPLLRRIKTAAAAVSAAFTPQLTMPAPSAPTSTVTPAASTGRSGAAQTVINITVNGALDAKAVARELRDLFNSDARLRGVTTMNGVQIA